jgi:peroxiredoxin
MSQLAVGVEAPDFELETAEGRIRRLSEELARRPVILVFYKASCSTCQFAFPFIQQIYSKVGKTAPWTLWAISEDDPRETLEFAHQHALTFELLIDEHPYAVSAAYGLQNVPAIFMVQKNGTISLSDFGFTKDTLNQIAGFHFFTPDDGLPSSRPG